jgi:ATP-binding cassette subfamily B protein
LTRRFANQSVLDSWAVRAHALRNVPVVLRLAWESGPGVLAAGIACRIAGALLPVTMLWVAKAILDAVQLRATTGELRPDFWSLVALECALAVAGAMLGRTGGFFDSLLSDRFTRHVSVRVMAHASRLT